MGVAFPAGVKAMSDEKLKDKYFIHDQQVTDFVFDKKVARVFDDMVSRSVPFYMETQMMALRLACHFVRTKTNIYDLGCSTGTVLGELAAMVPDSSVGLIGIDNSESMLNEARKKLSTLHSPERVELRNSDLSADIEIRNASVVIMNYTLQFIRPLQREALVQKIYNGLCKNGCLILVEKVLGNDSLFNRLYIELYYEYKRQQGYSESEIAKKREALENILIPYRIDENMDMLKKCGFSSVDIFYKWYNFAGFIAVR